MPLSKGVAYRGRLAVDGHHKQGVFAESEPVGRLVAVQHGDELQPEAVRRHRRLQMMGRHLVHAWRQVQGRRGQVMLLTLGKWRLSALGIWRREASRGAVDGANKTGTKYN